MPLDDLNDVPQGGVLKWIVGVIGPLAAAVYAVAGLASGHFAISTRNAGVAELLGADATAWGTLVLATAGAVHCHYFWGNTDALAPFADLGKAVAIVVLVLSASYLFWRISMA